MGLGPDLGAGLIDVSEDGVCVHLKAPLPTGAEAEVTFQRVGSHRPVKVMADVRWCVTDPDGGCRAGLMLRHRMLYTELMDLTRN